MVRVGHCLPIATGKIQDTDQTGKHTIFTDNLLKVSTDSEVGKRHVYFVIGPKIYRTYSALSAFGERLLAMFLITSEHGFKTCKWSVSQCCKITMNKKI